MSRLMEIDINLSLVLLTCIFLLIIYYHKYKEQCPPAKTIYKFIPRTFEEEQQSPVKVSDIFANMFSGSDPFFDRI